MDIYEPNPVENYISVLLRGFGKIARKSPPSPSPSPSPAVHADIPATIPVEDNDPDTSRAPGARTNSAAVKYLSVDICSLECIIPVSEVITVKSYLHGQTTPGVLLLDPGNLLSESGKPADNHNFMVILKTDMKVALLTESVNGIIAIADHDLRWRRNRTNRPWFRAVSIEHRRLLLDWRALYTMQTRTRWAPILA